MKSLFTYIVEGLDPSRLSKHGWSVAGSRSSKLLIFDLDDTLIHTTTHIDVVKDGKVIKKLTNQQYNTYELKPGESFDFSSFADPDKLFKEQFTSYWDTLKREYAKGTHISIITARRDANMVRELFLQNGIDIKQELVFAVSAPDFMYKGTVAQKKAKVIKLLYRLGYTTMIFFDDNEENLKAAKLLSSNRLKIHTVKA